MTDNEIIVLAEDFKGTYRSCGVTVDDFDAVGFARAIEQASRRAALEDIVKMVELMPLESFASDSYIRQTARNRQQIVDAIRALSQQPAKDGP